MILNWSLRDLEVGFSQLIISLNCLGKSLGISGILQVLAWWFCHFKIFLLRRLLGNVFYLAL